MLTHYIKILSLTPFIALTGKVCAQENIPISDSLAAHAEILELKKGYISGKKIKKFHFGEYSMHTYKRLITRNKENENFFGTKTESESLYSSSFMLSNSVFDTAQVVMAHQSLNKTKKNMVLGIVHFGDDELMSSEYFSAWITINRDTSETWTLFVGATRGLEVEDTKAAYLSNGERTIHLTLVQALQKGTNIFGMPAMGYEFVEEGISIGAIQLFSGKLNFTSNTVWIDHRLDTKTKLLLATAMTALVYDPNEIEQ